MATNVQKSIEKWVFRGKKCKQYLTPVCNLSSNAMRSVFQDKSGKTMTTRH